MVEEESPALPVAFDDVAIVRDDRALCYAVNAYIYDEDPSRLFVTCRGAGGARPLSWKLPGCRRSPHAGLSVYDISSPSTPVLAERWDAPNRVEGQDRAGSLLVVTNVGDGVLYTFEADAVARGPTATCKLSVDGALHVRLHRVPAETEEPAVTSRLYALVTSGFATRFGLPYPFANKLVAVDVTDPSAPVQMLAISAGVPQAPEGIFTCGGFAYVGGVRDSRLSVFDLSSLPHAIVHVGTCRDAAYAQCVGQGTHSAAPTPPPLLYAALWASPGGVGVFRLDTGGAPVEVARHVSPLCAKSNRVVLLASGSGRARALLPLESFPGGVALVDVGAGEASLSAPPSADGSQECELLGRRMFTGPKDTCYCAAAVSSSHVYAFAAHACTMHVLRMRATGVSDPKPL